MKLIDLLVKELPRRGGWPEGAEIAVQDADSQICFSSHSDVYANKGQTDWYGGDWGDGDWRNPFIDTIADDRHECIVSRKQYEAALAASKAVVGHNGWIQWAGGECPVDGDAVVEVKYRKPNPYQYNNDRAGDFSWAHDGIDGDIIAYRLHDQGINARANDDQLEQDLNECIGQSVDVPEWDGEGLPPVGAKVEFFINPKLGYSNDWIPDVGTEMEVVAHKTTTDGNDVAVCYWDEGGAGRSRCFVPESLKPLRTESEMKREAAAKEMARHANSDQHRKFNAGLRNCLSIYDAIAEGKIPGVKLED